MAPAPPRSSLLDRLRRAGRVNLIGGVPLGQVVDDLFESVLLRPADPPSRAYYLAALRRGVPWSRVVEAVHTSGEAVDNSRRMPLTTALGPAVLARARHHGDEPAVYLCDLPGSGAGGVLDRLTARAGDRLVVSGLTLDQLLWAPELIRHRASVLSGPWGRAALPLLAPGTFKVVVVAHPLARAARHLRSLGMPAGAEARRVLAGMPTDPQARCLAAEVDVEGAWTRWAPERAEDGAASLQALLERGGPGAAEADRNAGAGTALARRAVAALDRFDLAVPTERADRVVEAVAGLWGSPGDPSGTGAGPRESRGLEGEGVDLPGPLADQVLAANRADLALYEAVRDRAGSSAAPA